MASWALALLGIGTALGATLRSQSELNVAYDIGGPLGGALTPAAELARPGRPFATPGCWSRWPPSPVRSPRGG